MSPTEGIALLAVAGVVIWGFGFGFRPLRGNGKPPPPKDES